MMESRPLKNHANAPSEHMEVCEGRCIHPEHVLAVRQHSLPTEQTMHLAAFFDVLADPTRLQVLYALLHAPTGELCVCDLASGLRRDETTISHQLRVLRHQRIVATRKVGRIVYYRLIDEHIRQMLRLGLSHTHEVPLQSLSQDMEEVSA